MGVASDSTASNDSRTTLWLRINNPVILGHRGPYRYVSGGRIDCEVEYAEHGWEPCTLAPDDAQTAALFASISANPNITPEPYIPPSPEEELSAARANMSMSRRQSKMFAIANKSKMKAKHAKSQKPRPPMMTRQQSGPRSKNGCSQVTMLR